MSEGINLTIAFLAGILLGLMFFGGLWLTVLRIVSSRRPALWLLGSLVVRTAFTISGFYFASNGRLDRLLLCVLGLFVSRIIVMRFTRIQEILSCLQREASRAP